MEYVQSEILISEVLQNDDLSLIISPFDKIIKRISKNTVPLKSIINFNQGIITGNNKEYLTKNIS